MDEPDGFNDYDECLEAAVCLVEDEEDFRPPRQRPRRDRHSPTPPDDHSAPPNVCGVLGGILYRAAEVAEAQLRASVRRGLSVALTDSPRFEESAWWDKYEKGRREKVAAFGVRDIDLRQVLVTLLRMDRDPVPNTVQATAAEEIWDTLEPQLRSPDTSQFERREFVVSRNTPENGPLALRNFWDESTNGADRPLFPDQFRPCGYLFLLHLAARVLAERYCWDVVGALGFLIRDLSTPTMHVVKVQYRVRAAHPAASRIVLTLDPHLSPDQVREIYADAQGKFVGPQKAQSDSSLALVGFVYTQTHTPLDTQSNWRLMMDAWNACQDERESEGATSYRRFTDVNRFKEAASRAKAKLTCVETKEPDGAYHYFSTKEVEAERRANAAKRRLSGMKKPVEIGE